MAQSRKSAKKSFIFIFSRGNFRQFFAQMTLFCLNLGQVTSVFGCPMQTRITRIKKRQIEVFVNGHKVMRKTILSERVQCDA